MNLLDTSPLAAGAGDYPPLPDAVAHSLGLAKYAHSSNIIAAHEFTPDTEHADEWEALHTATQMRAYVDADRAARAAPSEAHSPATVAQSVTDEQIDALLDVNANILDIISNRRERLRRLARKAIALAQSGASQGCVGAVIKPLTDEALKAAYENAQWAWGGKGDVDSFFLTFGRRVEAAHGITSLPANTSEGA